MSDEVGLDTETDQQLVDRLVHAAEEEDLLYVEICLRRLLERGVMDAVTRQHSWKGVSALVLVATSPHSKLSQLIFQVLLLRLNTSIHSAFLGVDLQSWSRNVIVSWERRWRYNARQAVEISGLSDESAVAGWLDVAVSAGDLPDPPNPQNLTGCGPLPPPPSPPMHAQPPPPPRPPPPQTTQLSSPRLLETQSAQVKQHLPPVPPPNFVNVFVLPPAVAGQASASGDYGYRPYPPPTAPPSQLAYPSASPAQAQASFIPPRSSHDDHPIRIRVGNLPPKTTEQEVVLLFQAHGLAITSLNVVHMFRTDTLEVYGTLPCRAVWYSALGRIHQSYYGGRRIYLDRDRPDFDRSDAECARHPVVVLEGLSSGTTSEDVNKLARKTRCGVYGAGVKVFEEQGQRVVRGTFRTSSPLAASDAVKALREMKQGGRELVAWWEHPPSFPSQAPPIPARDVDPPRRTDSYTQRVQGDSSSPPTQRAYKPSVNLFSALLPKPSITNSTCPPSSSSAYAIDPTPSPIDFSPTSAVEASPPPPYSSAPPTAAYNTSFLSSSACSIPSPASALHPSSAATSTANPFGGILSAPLASTGSSSSPSSLPLLDKIPPRSTPSPFLPGCAPASKRSAKRKAGEVEGKRETEAKGGEGERGKVRKVSFAE